MRAAEAARGRERRAGRGWGASKERRLRCAPASVRGGGGERGGAAECLKRIGLPVGAMRFSKTCAARRT